MAKNLGFSLNEACIVSEYRQITHIIYDINISPLHKHCQALFEACHLGLDLDQHPIIFGY